MQFYIEGYADDHGVPNQNIDIYPHVKLVTDNFDDYGRQTLFRMYYKADKQDQFYSFMGKVKILSSENSITRNVIPLNFTKLSNRFCSLGQSVEYYKNLRELNRLDVEWGSDILTALNDIAINSDIKRNFSNQDGINSSLMRDSEAYHANSFGHNVYYGMPSHIQGKVAFTYTYDEELEKKVFFEFNDNAGLPDRINVVVGKNGTGKTKMLSSLASILSGRSKSDIKSAVDARPKFSRYIAVSYSAFDNFEKPFAENYSKRGMLQERQYIIDEISRQKERCRQRADTDKDFHALWLYFEDVLASIRELEKREKLMPYFEDLSKGKGQQNPATSDNSVGSYVYCGLVHENRIISEGEMYVKFRSNLAEITRMNRIKIWEGIMKNIFDNTEDFQRLFSDEQINADNIIEENFYALSSGQKIISHIFTQVIASITEDSLLLVDEPEIHLHPNAISSFMRILNALLDEFNSFAIISTHSPIVLQEIPAKYVRIFDNNESYDTKLWEECFGDNISNIIKNVFNVRPDESNYKTFFLQKKEERFTKEEIEKLFDCNLSMNAQLYLNLLYGDEKISE